MRAALNFKGVPYTQSWVSYPDIKPLITGFGLPPNEAGLPYTLPAIIHKSSITSNPHGAMMDSLPIIEHLDKVFPSPPLFPSGDASYALLIAVSKILTGMSPGFRNSILPRVPEYLDERGAEYFLRTRAEWYGKPLAEVMPSDQEKEELWKIVEKESEVLIKMLKGREGKKGPFFEGEVAGFADMFVACYIAWFERFDKAFCEKFLGLGNGEIKALYEACLPWLEGQGEEKECPVPQ